MTALIVVFIVLSLMGSALWIKPSRRDREKMNLRMAARKHGILVQLTSVDLPDKWDKTTNKVSVSAYRKYRAKPLKDFTAANLYTHEVWKHEALCDGWFSSRSIDLEQTTKDLLQRHKDVFLAIEVRPEGVSLFWTERGDEQTVEAANQIIEALFRLR
ncbi:hypothetical protein [Marinomonas ostreistagni]|uniref:hypothetical protein n=1 Tax=Marinomonas ostreistagni TaxID=359209 RepID=UPI0019514E1B|nr:hypothetical protein [Marinomonas ostreistagni]MBM6550181.1 hypothetical protein [Marinomonas ostreistagni]